MRHLLIAVAVIVLVAMSAYAAEPTTAPATSPGAAVDLAGPAGGLLPGAETPLAEAMKGQVTLVAALQAIGPPRLEPGFSGVVYATQTFRVLDSVYEHDKAGETITIRYGYLVPGMHSGRTDRAVRADEKVVWILHNDTFGIDRGTKALPDTPENRLAARKLVAQLPADLRETVEIAKVEALTARLCAIKPKGWSGGNMSGGKVEPRDWEAGKGMKFVWSTMDDKPELKGGQTGQVIVWIMDAGYSGRLNEDAGNQAWQITVWRGRRVFYWSSGDVWPTAQADILQAMKCVEGMTDKTNQVPGGRPAHEWLSAYQAGTTKWFGAVWPIVHATNGVPDLIRELSCADGKHRELANTVLRQLYSDAYPQAPSTPTNAIAWTKWWEQVGKSDNAQSLWHNFDSHYK